MDLDLWLTPSDPRRRRRLTLGGLLGTGIMAGATALILSTAGAVMVEDEEDEGTIVSLEAELPAEETEREPAPPPVNEEVLAAAGPRLASLRVPTALPTEPPREVDAKAGAGSGTGADPYAATGGRGRASAATPAAGEAAARPQAVAKAPPAPPPRPQAVTLVEGMTPPKPLAQPMPAYPEELRARGVEGVCVVRYKIDENGAIAGAKLVEGPTGFWPVIASAMRNWRFSPALDSDGKPVAVTRTHRFKFGLDTG